ncbi:hypothetical protein [Rhodopila sp.]|uniref:hypothetical protein n=1 Tax=Rhodopila sp. TaxID=2480087 RepID=UPI003D114C3E
MTAYLLALPGLRIKDESYGFVQDGGMTAALGRPGWLEKQFRSQIDIGFDRTSARDAQGLPQKRRLRNDLPDCFK